MSPASHGLTPNLGLPLLAAAQAQKHVTHNEALDALDALVHLVVAARDREDPPTDASEGERWIVGPAPTGAWAGRSGEVALWRDGAWRFFQPRAGWIAHVLAEDGPVVHDGTSWRAGLTGALQGLQRLGLGTQADAAVPFAARLNTALWTARPESEGGTGDLRLVLDKAIAAAVASIVFQCGFSGRAEIGLAGGEDLMVKTSPDGTLWRESIVVERASGIARLPTLPAFRASYPAGAHTVATTSTDLVFSQVQDQNGGGYDPLTGRFTAPVPGRYVFSGCLDCTAASGARMVFARNGGQIFPIAGQIAGAAVPLTAMFSLAAGDTVSFRTAAGHGSVTFNGVQSVFWGALLG